MAETIEWWDVIGGVLRRRGNFQVPGFEPFVPMAVKPQGLNDPGPRNVGVRPGVGLRRYEGDLILSPGQPPITGLDIVGSIGGRGSILRDCIIRGPNRLMSQKAAAVGTSYNFGGALFENCLFTGEGRESPWTDGMNGGNYTMRYCQVTRFVDGIGANATGGAVIEACRIDDGAYFAWWNNATDSVRAGYPPQSSGDNHADGVQIHQGKGWVLRGNYIGGPKKLNTPGIHLDPEDSNEAAIIAERDSDGDFQNTCIIVNTVGAANPVGALIEGNWLEGGITRLQLAAKPGDDDLSGVIVRNNRFIRNSWQQGNGNNYLIAKAGHGATITGNVWDDTGLPINTVIYA